jgi:hypothetical protein
VYYFLGRKRILKKLFLLHGEKWIRFGNSFKTFRCNQLLMSVLVPENQKQVLQKSTIIKSGVEMIGLINKRGRMTESNGFDSLNMPKSKKEMFLMKIALRSSMQSDFDEELGKVDYCMTQRGDRKFISIPTFGENTVLVVAKNYFDSKELVNNIAQKLKNSDQFRDILLKGGVL